MPQGRPTGAAFRAREFRRSASLYWECEGFETDNLARQSAGMRRAATLPHGSTHTRRNDDAEISEPIAAQSCSRDCFASLAMTAEGVIEQQTPSLRGARSATKQSPPPGWVAAFWRNEPEISFWRNEPEVCGMEPRLLRFARNDVDGSVDAVIARSAQRDEAISATRGAAAVWRNEPKKSFWRNEPEISNSFNGVLAKRTQG